MTNGIGPGLDGKLLLSAEDFEATYPKIDLKYDHKSKQVNESLIVGAVYRPPNNNDKYMDWLCESIQSVVNNNKKSIVGISGDLNLPDIEWKNCNHC